MSLWVDPNQAHRELARGIAFMGLHTSDHRHRRRQLSCFVLDAIKVARVPLLVLGLWGNSASTASTGELLGTERVQNPMHTTSAVFLSGTVITVIGSDEQCLVLVGFCCTARCRTCLVDFTGKIHVIYGVGN